LVDKGKRKPGSEKIKKVKWIESKVVKDRTLVNLLTATLQKGEAEVLCLAKELNADLVLLDEEKARKSAILAGFEVMGLIGLLVLAKELGLIKEVRSLIDELRKKRFRVSERIVVEALKKAREVPSKF
jgi:predicted nucleic acid-binding protein